MGYLANDIVSMYETGMWGVKVYSKKGYNPPKVSEMLGEFTSVIVNGRFSTRPLGQLLVVYDKDDTHYWVINARNNVGIVNKQACKPLFIGPLSDCRDYNRTVSARHTTKELLILSGLRNS